MSHKPKTNYPVVVVERNWKDFIGECLLIVFSVVLALAVTELINNINDKKRTKEILHNLEIEINTNRRLEEEQFHYHQKVVELLDSAIANPVKAAAFIEEGKLNLKVIFPPPYVVLLHDLNDVAWQTAKQNGIISRIDIDMYTLLNDIYNNQLRVTNSEEKIAEILFRYDSRKPENVRTTLIILRDNYIGWNVERAPNLLKLYTEAMNKLKMY